jgi:cytoskeleton protein RodZ
VRDGLPETGEADRPVRSVGSYLREVRESRGLSLDEAARVTRIGKNYLLAIEGEMFDKLPSPAYVKGFLRIYGGYLGLPGDELVAMYDRSLAVRQPQSVLQGEQDEPRPSVQRTIPGAGRWLIPLFLLVIVVAAAYIIGGRERITGKATHVASQPREAAAPPPIQPPRSTAAQKGEPVASPPLKSAAVQPGGGERPAGIILRLKVNQDCWLNITIDNVVSQQYDLKGGDLIEWKGEKVFALDIGNAGGVEGELNGRPLQPFGAPGKTAHVVLKADGAE